MKMFCSHSMFCVLEAFLDAFCSHFEPFWKAFGILEAPWALDAPPEPLDPKNHYFGPPGASRDFRKGPRRSLHIFSWITNP